MKTDFIYILTALISFESQFLDYKSMKSKSTFLEIIKWLIFHKFVKKM